MTKLGDALRRKFRTPQDAIQALGLDASLIEADRGSAANGDNQETTMTVVKLSPTAAVAKGAIGQFLRPRLAQDAKIDLNPILSGVTGKNFAEKRPAIATAVKAAVEGKLAKDADIGDLAELIDALKEEPDAVDLDPNAAVPPMKPDAEDAPDMLARIKDFLKDHCSPEILAQLDGLAGDEEDDDEKKKAEEAATAAKDAEADPDDKKPEGVTKSAMDAAIKAATKAAVDKTLQTQREIREAVRVARPYVGELPAMDEAISGDDVYRHALTALGVKVAGIDPSAFRTILELHPKAGAKPAPRMAQDAAAGKGFFERNPAAARIGVL